MATKFFTNDGENTLLEKFRGVFRHNPHIAEFDALVGYFYSTGYFHLRPHLQDIGQMRVLVGIDVDTITAQAQGRGLALLSGATQEQASRDYTRQFQEEIDGARYDRQTERSIEQFVQDIADGKIAIRAHPARKLHAKIYIFRPQAFNEHSGGEVISGSSNLTAAGLGADGDTANYEFNVSLRDYDDIQFATNEFEKLWHESVAILPEAVMDARNKTYLRGDFTPFELYIKLLVEYFGREVEFDPNSITDVPDGFKRLNYQLDAVEQGYILLQNHHGFFLSDVVGLGKTVVATLIARKHFFLNKYPEYRSHTLIVCPPAVCANWRETVDQFQLDNVDLMTTGSLHTITDPKKYDLIIVDEAHKFRNDTSTSYAELQRICKTPCRNDGRKRVILVSATPLNNRPEDIRNQLLLFQDASDSTLDINIARFFSRASREYKDLIKPSAPADAVERLESLYAGIRRKIIEPLTVRRTRTDLLRHPLYADDLQCQGIVFPKVEPPANLLYQLEPELNDTYQHSFDLIRNQHGNGLQYMRYRLIEYLKPEHKQDYQRPEFIAERLAAIMKTLLIKRLDSSFYAFHQSLKRFVHASRQILDMMDNNRVYLAPKQQIDQYLEEDREEELLEKLVQEQLTDPSIKVLTRDDFEPGLFALLQQDHALLQQMEAQWRKVVDQKADPKLELLLAELPKRLLNAEHNPERKLVIFSESADTTGYLYGKLRDQYRVLSIDSHNRALQQDIIRQNFDANLPLKEQKSDCDILIATESLAEGVNLHRANTIVNYDTPWNATRLMQRIGRLNRIGSPAGAIYIYNFLPTEQVEDDIGLKRRAQVKLQAFHTALGEDSQIYSVDEKVETFGLFDRNITEPEEVSGRLAYLMEIRAFREKHPDEFRRIKNLPLKIRNAVADPERSGATLCFLRNSKHNAFYQVDHDNQVTDLGFLEVAPIFKSHHNAALIKPLPDAHYNQVQRALAYFMEQVQDKIIKEQQAPELTPQQRTAINYLQAFINLDITHAREQQRIAGAIEWVKLGRYQNLPREIAKLQRSQKNSPVVPARQLEALIKIIDKHAPETTVNDSDEPPAELQANERPRVVISQSYL